MALGFVQLVEVSLQLASKSFLIYDAFQLYTLKQLVRTLRDELLQPRVQVSHTIKLMHKVLPLALVLHGV